MELTAIIIFTGALIMMALWILKTVLFLIDPKTQVGIMMGGHININLTVPLVLFVVIAISAGIIWG